MAIDSWSLVRVFGTWVDHQGVRLPGRYKITVPSRLTTAADDLMIPGGIFASGELSVASNAPSLSILCPSTDDPDIQQSGWKLAVEITFTGGQATERYTIDVPIADRPAADGGSGLGVNLRTIALAQQITPQIALYGVGVPGGLARLSSDGTTVLNADGDPIAPGGGATTIAGITGLQTALDGKQPAGSYATAAQGVKADSAVQPSGLPTWGTLTGRPAVVAAGTSAAAARAAIGITPDPDHPGLYLIGA